MAEHDFGHFDLRLLGAPDLRAPDGRRVSSVLSQPRRLALLAYLGLTRAPVSRSTLAALFWPESDEARARNSLSQAVFFLRRSLDSDLIQSVEGDRLWVVAERLRFDARDVLSADEITPQLAALCRGEFIAGWNADDSQPLQEWLDTRRREIRDIVASAPKVVAVTEPSPRDTAGTAPATPRAPVGSAASDRFSGPGPTGAKRVWASRRQLALVILLLGLSAAGGWMASRTTATPVGGLLIVLMPEIQSMPGATQLTADAVHNELLAQLRLPAAFRMIGIPSASTFADLMRQVRVLDPAAQPDFALEVEIRANRETLRVTFRLYEGPPPWRDTQSGGFSLFATDDPLVVLPQRIAREVSDSVAVILDR